MNSPNPKSIHPMIGYPQVCYVKNTISNPNILVGDFTYYDDPDGDGAAHFEKNVLYHFPFVGDKLIIGKFCAIAKGTQFIMNGANHKLLAISTYPFQIFANGWEKVMPAMNEMPHKGDTQIGNDVWLGYESLIMQGVKIGNGAIISSRSVVTRDIPPYTIAGGNPAKVIKQRFPTETINQLEAIAWWDWPIEKISQHLEIIVSLDVDALHKVAEQSVKSVKH